MKILILFLTTFLFFNAPHLYSQNNVLAPYEAYFNNDLKDWSHSFKNFQLSKFKLSDTSKFENIPFGDTENIKGFYGLYKPGLSFSLDSNFFLDIYSYWLNLEQKENKIVANPEVDQAVSLCDLKNNKWARIFFCGYSTRIDEVVWLTNSKFILAGTSLDNDNLFHPTVFIGDITKQIFLNYTDSSSVATKTGCTSAKLKKLNIQKE